MSIPKKPSLLVGAISPLDGRYREKVAEIGCYFSEEALMRYRLFVEIEYLIFLHASVKELKPISLKDQKTLKNLHSDFSQQTYNQIKKIESKSHHDVNAVVEYLSLHVSKKMRQDLAAMVHFGLTSEDINNLAYGLMVQDACNEVLIPQLKVCVKDLEKLAKTTVKMPLLALTHGQPATPTTLGKELQIFVQRINRQLSQLSTHRLMGKLGGATGSLAAHHLAFPQHAWQLFSKRFVHHLGLEHNPLTTQVESGDSLAELFHLLVRINNIFLDLSVDLWHYISRNLFFQQNNAKEVGSSVMPHKINPIHFENAEGNLELANQQLVFFANKLTRSRLQRDLSGSTVMRNLGVSLAHSLLGYKSVQEGLSRLMPNQKQLQEELNQHWSILTEAIQTILRKSGDQSAYDNIKKLSKGKMFDQNAYIELVNSLVLNKSDKELLLSLSPENYIGVIDKIMEKKK